MIFFFRYYLKGDFKNGLNAVFMDELRESIKAKRKDYLLATINLVYFYKNSTEFY